MKDQLSKKIANLNLLNDVLKNDKYFYDESVHYNSIGHKLVSKRIYEVIKNDLNN